jgi:hypothetical protein
MITKYTAKLHDSFFQLLISTTFTYPGQCIFLQFSILAIV